MRKVLNLDMKIEITVSKSNDKEGYFTASATTSLRNKEKFGINCTPEDIGNKVAELIKKLNDNNLIGRK